ncbi:hypothetical protein [Candidatus Poriferisodalis sp.]|uniref:hypothetical protein n=1 Tax=Candidatus Poriferisodalis sp. TaxID=3101277 RepID=UPI003B02CD18
MDEYCERDRPPPARFVDIAAGRTHTCGLLADGRVQCWGNLPSEYGYTGTASSRAWSSFVAIDAHDYTCGLRVDRSIFCWDEERHYPRSPGRLGATLSLRERQLHRACGHCLTGMRARCRRPR